MTTNADRFHAVYKQMQEYLLDDAVKTKAVDVNRRKYLQKMMDVTVLGGKYNRGMTVVEVTDLATKDWEEAKREDALFNACLCGWMIEMMQAHFLVEDDIMDSSITRRGKPCWYRHPGVTTQSAINDGLIVLAWCTQIAFHYFKGRSFLPHVLEIFHNTDYQTTIGQLYDVSSMYDSEKLDPDVQQPTTTDFKEFTLDHYKRIVKFKTAYYTYFAPLVLGLAVCEKKIDEAEVERLAVLMGEYFQVQDDVLDCFADPKVLGKIGTDIEDMKCSWLAVTFLDTASEAQIAEFNAIYGKHDAADVQKVKDLYRDAKLMDKFEKYEQETEASVKESIAALMKQDEVFATACTSLWNKTFKRKK